MEIENPDAGWYRDPVDPGRFRYWDGTGWTHQVRSPEVSTALAVVRPERAAATTPQPAVAPAAAANPAPAPPTPAPPTPAPPTPAPIVSEVAGLYADDDLETGSEKPKRRGAKAKGDKAKGGKGKGDTAKGDRPKLRRSKVEKLKDEREPSRPKVLVAAAVIALAAIGVTAALTFFGDADDGGATADGAAATEADFAVRPARNACIRALKDQLPGSQNQIAWQPIERVTHRSVGDQVQLEFWGDDPDAPADRQRSHYLCVVDGADVTRVDRVYVTVAAPVG